VFIESAKNKGYDVLLFDTPLTPHYVQFLETKLEKASFARVDADTIDKLIKKDEAITSNLTEDQEKELKEVIDKLVDTKSYSVQFEALTENDAPMIITRPEFMRRMKDQQAMGGGGMMGMGNFPDMYNLIVNSNHPLTSKILIEEDAEKKSDLAQQAVDLALLSQNLLKGNKLSAFLKRSVELID
jgi:molecular chaperone HtpG